MQNITFVLLSFEGPDQYAHAGGLGTRVAGMSRVLAETGFETHVFFIGDPELPGHEVTADGRLHLHRWCQWISRYHPGGVYDGENGKLEDWNRSVPIWLEEHLLRPIIAAGGSVIVLAEEWQTAASVIALRQLLVKSGWQSQVKLLWNANNTFGFDRIDWPALRQSASVTTVSKYMKHVLWKYGVDARVIPNGIPDSWLTPVDRRASQRLARATRGRITLAKVARWDPDKRWEMAVDAVAFTKRLVGAPLFLARGGTGGYGQTVLERARQRGLRLATVSWSGDGVEPLIDSIQRALDADMLVLEGYLTEQQRKLIFHTADAVLANSGIEPFGLVGLETMAVGGVALVGCTGEDYVTPGHDAVSVQSNDPREIVHHVNSLAADPEVARRMRQAAKATAARYTWQAVINRVLVPYLGELGAVARNGQNGHASSNGHPGYFAVPAVPDGLAAALRSSTHANGNGKNNGARPAVLADARVAG